MKILLLSLTLLVPTIAFSETSKVTTEEKPEVFRSFSKETEKRLDDMERQEQRMEEGPDKSKKDLKEHEKTQDANPVQHSY